ncbi:hypothetical protein J2741_001179 [Methanolinea mesophila]|uniref:DUF2098 domain-containing protein n=1 Tax=Methanolinea mesophila TaxID=547055 RepID=UPI001AE7FF0E|nr:DUF2098 domain-containing protein [Methanolinea mesophila]MBP1928632.1 hypothetical protein [Methanolinea mesophila]
MNAGSVEVGMKVRYTRTGTTGRVIALQENEGETFAELDSTHLFYRVDQLVPADKAGKAREANEKGNLEKIKEEREYYSGTAFQEAVSHSDQSCEGGG